MTGRAAKLPALPPVKTGNAALDAFLAAVKERLEVREGARGDILESVVTKRDLEALGLVITGRGGTTRGGTGGGDLVIRLPGGGTGTITVDDLVRRIRNTALFRSLVDGPNDPSRFNAFPDEVKRLLLQSIAEEAARRGADIRRMEQTIQTLNRSLAMRVDEVTASVSGSASGVRQTVMAYADQSRAMAAEVTQLQARLNDVGGVTIEQALIAIADSVDGLSGEWYVKIQAGNKVAGVGLSAVEDPDGNSDSAFIVLADKFAVVTPTDTIADPLNPPANRIPFAIDGNQLVINGNLKINTSSGATLNELGNAVHLDASTIFFNTDALGTTTPASITLTAQPVGGATGTYSWATSPAVTLGGAAGDSTRTLSAASMGGNTRVKITVTLTDGPTTYTSQVFITRVEDGAPGATGSQGPQGPAGSPGAAGSAGADGLRGSVTAYVTGQSSWSNPAAVAAIQAYTGTSYLVVGDTVTQTNGLSFVDTRFWSGSAWVQPGVIINGNLLVNGTVGADKIGANAVTTAKLDAEAVTAVKMAANSITAANGAIADLTVGTLKVINNAITLPLSVAGGSQILDFNYLNLCSVGATMSGSNVFILGQVYVHRPSAPNPTEIELKLRDTNGTLNEVRVEMPGTAGPRIAPVIMYVGSVANAFRTFYLDARLVGAAGGTVLQSGLFVIETKK
ncbi:MAG: DUF1983 domain-containing protein [Trueperaceae bacterium]